MMLTTGSDFPFLSIRGPQMAFLTHDSALQPSPGVLSANALPESVLA
jgi:hypothetical protein